MQVVCCICLETFFKIHSCLICFCFVSIFLFLFECSGVGFPRDCGPTGLVTSQWNSLSVAGGKYAYQFVMYYPSLTTSWTYGNSVSQLSYTTSQSLLSVYCPGATSTVSASGVGSSMRSVMNGLQLYMYNGVDGGTAYAVYQNLPSFLIGLPGTTFINGESNGKEIATCYLHPFSFCHCSRFSISSNPIQYD